MKKNRKEHKMSAENVQGMLAFRRKGGAVPAKKGKRKPYKRNKFKKDSMGE